MPCTSNRVCVNVNTVKLTRFDFKLASETKKLNFVYVIKTKNKIYCVVAVNIQTHTHRIYKALRYYKFAKH